MKKYEIRVVGGDVWNVERCEGPLYDPSGRWVSFTDTKEGSAVVFSQANVICFQAID